MGVGPVLAPEFEESGYVSVRGALTAAEVARLRSEVDTVLDRRGLPLAGGTVLPNAAVSAPELSWLFGHQTLVALAADVLGVKRTMFTLEADLHRNYLATAWHKDTGEPHMEGGYFGRSPFGSSDCRIVKLGIYLQDHLDGSGLHVRAGSHRTPELREGRPVAVDGQAGDVVLFDVRMTHRGVRPTLADQLVRTAAKVIGTGGHHPRSLEDTYRRRYNAGRSRPDRLAIFFAFGLCNANSQNFASRNMARQLQHLQQSEVALPDGLRRAFDTAGVEIARVGG